MRGVAVAAVVAGVVASAAVLRARYVVVLVHGASMQPTLHDGERVLVRRCGLPRLRREQLVVFATTGSRGPDDPPWLVKRLVGLPGDPVPDEVPAVHRHGSDRVPPGLLVVLGDNTAASYDSRRGGYVDAATVLGVVVRRLSLR